MEYRSLQNKKARTFLYDLNSPISILSKVLINVMMIKQKTAK